MRKILLVAATALELEIIKDKVQNNSKLQNLIVDILVTGVGAVATTYHLLHYLLHHTTDLVINVGISGAFDQRQDLGGVFQLKSDFFGDLGAEDSDGSFLSINDLGIADSSHLSVGSILVNSWHFADTNYLPEARGVTVNLIHGYKPTIDRFCQGLQADLESMEGAAVFYTCMKEGIPVLQLRSISNHVTARDRDSWKMNNALENLASKCLYVLENTDRIRQRTILE